MSLANLRRSLLMTRVPTTTAVVRGASVNIVLKADQPTGRTVSGAVQDVLTRGNHPRGIKVRLTDGRVGRVQSMAGAALQAGSQPAASEVAVPPDAASWAPTTSTRGPARQRGPRDYRDEPERPSHTIGLDAYIKPAKTKRKGRGGPSPAGAVDPAPPPSEDGFQSNPAVERAEAGVVTCPVCGAFEGDAAAVEHHVASHFD
ncbi:conserved hypothetical protein [Verticillium alfalfae VaMs.102]|uniref:UBZ4-type domain-containing protein n=1 Tax=Verticillium alfalfae (strain VaMs.102 / ATCC MYA-4576 / FGSC 10136) TaxID=526221 RepID=C9S670_VERA1|nr:conserved hypothetical protein [Verticillium alfalfae VaMs.102]EEY15132.1 conserved hypothetical protein [Verticillium alfalfae VaMs.102]